MRSNLNDLCASYQHRILSMLMDKLAAAAAEFGVQHVGLAGGVAANSGLRSLFAREASRFGWKTYIPDFSYCTDNAAMIAIAAHYKFLAGEFIGPEVVPVASLGEGFSL
ncbi:MAG: hypothetical protein ACKOAR_05695 [Bacteroidota bacterium]